MADNRPVLLITFANSLESQNLPHLVREMEDIANITGKQDALFKVKIIYNTTIPKLGDAIKELGDRVVLFMYSGHAGQLQIETKDHFMSAIGLANELGKCPQLKLVILNGCNSNGHISHLQEMDVPMVIATESPVGDRDASVFSASFFNQLIVERNSLENTFYLAIQDAQNYRKAAIEAVRGFETGSSRNKWILSVKEEQYNDWSLFDEVKETPLVSGYEPNKLLKDFLFERLGEIDEAIAECSDFSAAYGKILAKFPLFISNYIHNLCAPALPKTDSTTQAQDSFDQPDSRRLKKTIDFFSVLQEILLCLVLAEIRELFMGSKTTTAQESANQSGLLQPNRFNKMNSIATGVQWLMASKASVITEELCQMNIEKLIELAGYFEDTKTKVDKTEKADTPKHEKLHPKQIAKLCEEAEEKLVALLNETLFLVKYKFLTIKNMVVYKNRTNPKPDFGFKPSVYEWVAPTILDPAEKIEKPSISKAPDNLCVLVVKEKGNLWEQLQALAYLNVSPFLIDNNLLYAKATIPHLCFIDEVTDNQFVYRSFLTPHGAKYVVQNTKETKLFFDNIQSQFTHFNNLFKPTIN